MLKRLVLPLLLAAALLLGATHTQASTPCSTAGDGTQTTCYTQRATCSWDYLVSSSCITGAPATCEAYFTDNTGCATNALCALNSLNGRCYTRAPACSTLTQLGCGKRSDCTYSGTTCTATPSGCGVYSTGSTCASAGCYWDFYTSLASGSPPTSGGGQCFNGLSEVNLIFGCSRWNGYPITTFNGNAINLACSTHGCGLVGGLCVAVDQGIITADGGTQLTSLIDFAVINAQLKPESLVFNADVSIPLSNFWVPAAPIYTVVVIGDVLLTPANFPYSYTKPGICSSVLNLPQPQLAATYSDLISLYSYFVTRVQATHSLPFNTSDVRDQAINNIIGQYQFTNSTGPLLGADIPTGLTNINLHIGGSLATWANSCGVTKVVTGTNTQYTVPISVMTMTSPIPGNGSPMFAQDTVRLQQTIGTYGAVTISATSGASRTITIANVLDQQMDCAPGLQRRTWSIIEAYTSVDPTQIVGLRSIADVSMGAFVAGAPLNCFGTFVTSVTPPASCSFGVCTTVISFKTRCINVPADGSAFTLCTNAQVADRQADMGSPTQAYPTTLNGVQTFYQYPKSWSVAAGITDPYFSNAGFDPTGVVADTVTVSVIARTYPLTSSFFTLAVLAGLLPTPESPLSALVLLSNTTGLGSSITQMRNAQIEMSKSLTPVIELPNSLEQQTYAMSMDLASLRIYGLSSNGSLLTTTPIVWADLAPNVQRSPRGQFAVCTNGCQLLTAVNGAIGSDGFSVPVVYLQTKLPANGYRITVNFNITLPVTATSNSVTIGSRRLLSIPTDGTQGGTASMDFFFASNTTSTTEASSGGTAIWGALIVVLGSLTGGAIVIKILLFL